MLDSLLFIGVARQQGYTAAAAHAALVAVRARLAEAGVAGGRLYIFRAGGAGVGEGGADEPAARPRLLLAFQSADAALAFAQGAGLGLSPRLAGISLGQALAAMIRRPAIAALIVAHEHAAPAAPGALPAGTRIERAALIELLAGVTP